MLIPPPQLVENILISKDDSAKIGDFGVSKAIASEQASLTETQGTPGELFYLTLSKRKHLVLVSRKTCI